MKNWKLLIVILLTSPVVLACEKGCVEYQGNCACDAPANKAETVTDASVISDEKPPQDKMPSYQREGIHADMPTSTAAQDAIVDAQKLQANGEGKKAAGIQ